MSDRPEWFYSKRYGLGTGLPCAWQGWVVLLTFLAIISGTAFLFGESRPVVMLAIILPVTAVFILIAIRTTKGGWKWRWGKDKNTW